MTADEFKVWCRSQPDLVFERVEHTIEKRAQEVAEQERIEMRDLIRSAVERVLADRARGTSGEL